MVRAHPDVEQRLNLLQGMVFAACQLGAWCFDTDKSLLFTTSPHPKEYEMIAQTGGCLDEAMKKRDLPGMPYVLTGKFGIGWIAEWVHRQKGDRLLVMLGPMYLKNSSIQESLQRLDQHGLSAHLRQDYLRILGDIPFIHSDSLQNLASMLHYICYEENIGRGEIVFFSAEAEGERSPVEDEERNRGENDLGRMVAHEEMLLRSLGNGNAPEKDDGGYQGELQDFHLKDSLRQLKDNIIIFTALCSRTAIRNGVSLVAAKNVESGWICKIEDITGFGAAGHVIQSMYTDFQNLIQKAGESEGLSKGVRECRDYIRMNYTQALTVQDIARHCGYTEYYLTRKFHKETGMKLSDYIRSVRLDAAKVMLLTSKKDIQRISEELQFGSRSYFDRVFCNEVGMSPRKYRETMGLGQMEARDETETDE